MRRLYLTFDTEDFISDNSVWILHEILVRLRAHGLGAMFFITGHMAEKLRGFPEIVDLLSEHEIGYHSSSHSVHPTIFEFTDVPNYQDAYKISLERETAHVDPLTGKIEGKGGILALMELFKRKKITAYRAPGHCWVPPHLEALRKLGTRFDFSTSISREIVNYKGVTFYPPPITGHWQGKLAEYQLLLLSLFRNDPTIVTLHPSLLVNSIEWDAIYNRTHSNPKKLTPPPPRKPSDVKELLRNVDLLFKQVSGIQKAQIIGTVPSLNVSAKALDPSQVDVTRCYQRSMKWAVKQNYRPRFLINHFIRFFRIDG